MTARRAKRRVTAARTCLCQRVAGRLGRAGDDGSVAGRQGTWGECGPRLEGGCRGGESAGARALLDLVEGLERRGQAG